MENVVIIAMSTVKEKKDANHFTMNFTHLKLTAELHQAMSEIFLHFCPKLC